MGKNNDRWREWRSEARSALKTSEQTQAEEHHKIHLCSAHSVYCSAHLSSLLYREIVIGS